MAKDKILKPFVGIIAPENKFTVDTIDDLKSRNYLTLGDIVDLNGYYTAGDGAHHKRKIESADDGSGVQLANGLWANIVHNSYGTSEFNGNLTGFSSEFINNNDSHIFNDLRFDILSNNKDAEKLKENPNDIIHFRYPILLKTRKNYIAGFSIMRNLDSDGGQSDTGRADVGIKIIDSFKTIAKETEVKTIVNLGYNWQLTELNGFFNNVNEEICILFTGFKGKTGWGHAEQGTDENNTSQIFIVKSNDYGETWTSPENITVSTKPKDAFLFSTSPQPSIVLKNNVIVTPVYWTTTKGGGVGDVCSGYIMSRDGGETWSEAKCILKNITNNGGEGAFYVGEDGQLRYYCRFTKIIEGIGRLAIQKIYKTKDLDVWEFEKEFETQDCKFSHVTLKNGKTFFIGPEISFRNDMFVVDDNGEKVCTINKVSTAYTSCISNDCGCVGSLTETLSKGLMTISIFDLNSFSNNEKIAKTSKLISGTEYNIKNFKNFDNIATNGEKLFYKNNDVFEEISFVPKSTIIEVNSPTTILNVDNDTKTVFINNGFGNTTIEGITGGFLGQKIDIILTTSSLVVSFKNKSTSVANGDRVLIYPVTEIDKVSEVLKIKSNLEPYEQVNTFNISFTKNTYGWVRSS